MDNIVIAGWSGMYEILLIVLVLVLIYNGFLKKKVLTKINDNLDNHKSDSPTPEKPVKKEVEGEYVDYEIVND
ncbi:MAG: hypothetical protein ACI9N1_000721 [Flavobacteriales bacterium]